MKRNLYDLLPLLNAARQLQLKAIWDKTDNATYIYKKGKYYFISGGQEFSETEDNVKMMFKRVFGVRFDDLDKIRNTNFD